MLLIAPPGVYRAQEDTETLAEVLEEGGYAVDRDVLDVGCGSGAIALAAHRAGARSVTAVDLSMRSAATTWLNCRLRRADVTVLRGDLFGPVGDRRFDLIVANPPYVPAPTATLPRFSVARCWDGGIDGRAVLDRICAGAPDRLTARGRLLMVHSAVCGAQETLRRLACAGLDATVVARTHIPFGPVMRARARMLEARQLIDPGACQEELVVIEAHRAR